MFCFCFSLRDHVCVDSRKLILVTDVGCRFGAVACGVGQELYVFGGVRSRDADNPESSQMTICKSEFFHDELKRWVFQSGDRVRISC